MSHRSKFSTREQHGRVSTEDEPLASIGKQYGIQLPAQQTRNQKSSDQRFDRIAKDPNFHRQQSDTPPASRHENDPVLLCPEEVAATGVADPPRTRLVEFFSIDVFRMVLRDPTAAHRLRQFADATFTGESLEFLEKVDQYNQSLERLKNHVFDIHGSYLAVNAPSQINLPESVRLKVFENLRCVLTDSFEQLEAIFLPAQSDIEKLVAGNIYPQFVRRQISISATRALANDHKRYAGLGDCFCLTDARLADNPIVLASDGFVKITGYHRKEIIPRNCRFLRSGKTDIESTVRLKAAIAKRNEHVELLLNERKSGEPFWNLLYTTPLYDKTGKLAFFLGGQIDVSTAIHQNSDILRVLALAPENEMVEEELRKPVSAQRNKIFNLFRGSEPTNQAQNPGVESNLVEGMHEMTLSQQKRAFYAVYSKYLIIDAKKNTVLFCSAGTSEVIYDCSLGSEELPILDQDVFRVLGRCTAQSISREYKSSVKGAIKLGRAISLNLMFHTSSVPINEQFATHWTPLKDVDDNVMYVILVLGKAQK